MTRKGGSKPNISTQKMMPRKKTESKPNPQPPLQYTNTIVYINGLCHIIPIALILPANKNDNTFIPYAEKV